MSRPKLTPVEKFIKKYSFPGTPAAERMEKDLTKLLETYYRAGMQAGEDNIVQDEEASTDWFPYA